jgi:putative acetyltransferase
VALLEAHLTLMRAASPPDHVHALDIDGLTGPDISFYAAREADGALLGVGALRDLGPGPDGRHSGEVKSMHTAEAARGRGVGRTLVEHLVAVAETRGWGRLSLETGTMDEFEPARRLYRTLGFVDCPPFGDYTDNPYSVCMTLALG